MLAAAAAAHPATAALHRAILARAQHAYALPPPRGKLVAALARLYAALRMAGYRGAPAAFALVLPQGAAPVRAGVGVC